jgi:hypothetical protein
MDAFASEELIREFGESLRAAGLSQEAAARHRDRLRFFLHAYLMEEWPREITRADSRILRDYLGSWFIINVGGTKPDIANHLNTFQRFFEWLYQAGRVSSAERDDVIAACEAREYFMERLDEHMREKSPWPGRAPDLACQPGPALDFLPRGPGMDRRLWILAHNLDRPEPAAILDFALFLDYLEQTPVKPCASGRIPARHARRVNQRFTRPEPVPPGIEGPASMRRIKWFLALARELMLVRVGDKGFFEITSAVEPFLDLDPDSRIALILGFTWSSVPWPELGPRPNLKVSRWAQDHRDGFAALLSELTPDHEWRLDPDPAADRQDSLLARYILFHRVVEDVILFSLRECGLLKYKLDPASKGAERHVRSITINRFGRQVMRHFSRQAGRPDHTFANPLARLQEVLLLSRPSR